MKTQRSKLRLYVYVCYALPLLDNLVVAVLVEFPPYSPEPKNSSGLKLWLHMCCYWTVLAQNRSKHRRSKQAQQAIEGLWPRRSYDQVTSIWVVIICLEGLYLLKVMVAERGPDQVWPGTVRTSVSVLTTSKTENLVPSVVAGLFLCNESCWNNVLNALDARHPKLWSQFGHCSSDSSLWKYDFYLGKQLWSCSYVT